MTYAYTKLARFTAMVAAAMLVGMGNSTAQESEESAKPEQQSSATRWWDGDPWLDPERGFNWYPPDRPKARPTPKPQETKAAAPARKNIREMTSFEDVDKELNRLKAVAVFEPTERNVLLYLQAQEWVLSKSSIFADVARRVAWQNPDVDGNARQPIATYSAMNKRERLDDQRKKTMSEIAQTQGLVFFFRSDCPFCHDMAPVVKALSDLYGMQVIAVSMDGGNLPSFPRPRADNGISRFVSNGEGVRVVPSLYLVSNDTKKVQLIGSGALAQDEIVERIRVLTTTKPGEEM